jgi:hypothetical protein
MTTHDLTPDDYPLDLEAVNADDALVERLRQALSPDAAVVWDDDDEDDPGYALLRAVQLDVSQDLPVDPILPDEVIPLLPRRRHLSRGATVAVVAASVLSIGGVAAASAPGQPLAGVRHAVSDAVASAVDAITPDSPVGPAVAKPTDTATPSTTASPSPKPTPPGDAVSTAARSASAVLQIEANLRRAADLIDAGRYEPAKAQLDAAARKLGYVVDPVAHAALEARLTALQTRLAAMPTAKPTHGPAADKGKSGKGESASGTHGSDGQGGTGASHAPSAPPAQSSRSQSNRSTGVSKLRDRLPGDAAGGHGGRGNRDQR